MKAAWYSKNGPADEVLQVGDLLDPTPGPGEVLVRVRASGVNPSDTKSRGGRGIAFPRVVPNQDGSGEIVGVGSPELESRIGERVWFYESTLGRWNGSAAEYTTVPAYKAVRLPDGVSFEEGACLGIPAMTAWRCVFADGPVDGKTVMVRAAPEPSAGTQSSLPSWAVPGSLPQLAMQTLRRQHRRRAPTLCSIDMSTTWLRR